MTSARAPPTEGSPLLLFACAIEMNVRRRRTERHVHSRIRSSSVDRDLTCGLRWHHRSLYRRDDHLWDSRITRSAPRRHHRSLYRRDDLAQRASAPNACDVSRRATLQAPR